MDEIKNPLFTFAGKESLVLIGKINVSFDAVDRDNDNNQSFNRE